VGAGCIAVQNLARPIDQPGGNLGATHIYADGEGFVHLFSSMGLWLLRIAYCVFRHAIRNTGSVSQFSQLCQYDNEFED
jgi:hypothetical protein